MSTVFEEAETISECSYVRGHKKDGLKHVFKETLDYVQRFCSYLLQFEYNDWYQVNGKVKFGSYLKNNKEFLEGTLNAGAVVDVLTPKEFSIDDFFYQLISYLLDHLIIKLLNNNKRAGCRNVKCARKRRARGSTNAPNASPSTVRFPASNSIRMMSRMRLIVRGKLKN